MEPPIISSSTETAAASLPVPILPSFSLKRHLYKISFVNSKTKILGLASIIASTLFSAVTIYGTIRIIPLLSRLVFRWSPAFLSELETILLQQHTLTVLALIWLGILGDRILTHYVDQRLLLWWRVKIFFASHSMLLLSVLDTVLHWTLLLTVTLWLTTKLAKHHYDVHQRPLLDRYRWNATQSALGETYYHRHCTVEDLSTTDMSDLILQPDWDAAKAVDTLYTHGAAVFSEIVDHVTAGAFRNYTLQRNKRLSKDESVYVMNSYSSRHKHRRTRWSFAFSPNNNYDGNDNDNNNDNDNGVVNNLLHQVATNPRLVATLELLLGPDPAVIKMQTITAKNGADHQSWHPDVNAHGSAKSHARNFVQHWSLFVPLQDTLGDQGATGLCPGTHYCSSLDDDLISIKPGNGGCGQVHSGTNIGITGFNNTDDTTTAIESRPPQPVWLTGDAVLMNQNLFHRGWKHSNPHQGKHRAVVVITFTSRRRPDSSRSISQNNRHKIQQQSIDEPPPQSISLSPSPSSSELNDHSLHAASSLNTTGRRTIGSIPSRNNVAKRISIHQSAIETRVLGLGTPLSSFGLTLQDLKKKPKQISKNLRWRPSSLHYYHFTQKWLYQLRFWGLYKPPGVHGEWNYMNSVWSRISAETHKFQEKDLLDWIANQNEQGGVLQRFLMEYMVHNRVPKDDAQRLDRGIWDVWYSKTLDKCMHFLGWVCRGLGAAYLLTSVSHGLNRIRCPPQHTPMSLSLPIRLAGFLWRQAKPLALIALVMGGWHTRLQNSPLFVEIRSGRMLRPVFPNVTSTLANGNQPTISLVPLAGTRRITHGRGGIEPVSPDRHDVLFGTRFDSPHLWAANQMLDYHTGNQHWWSLLRETILSVDIQKEEQRPLVFEEQPKFLQDAIVESIVRETKGKYLLQMPENGKFTVMAKQDCRDYTRKAILLEEKGLAFILDKTVAYMISEMRYESSLRTTPLCSIAIGMLEELRENLFRAENEPSSLKGQLGVRRIPHTSRKQTDSLYYTTGLARYYDRESSFPSKAMVKQHERSSSTQRNRQAEIQSNGEAQERPHGTRAQRRRHSSLAYHTKN